MFIRFQYKGRTRTLRIPFSIPTISFKKSGGIDRGLLPETGRSSVEVGSNTMGSNLAGITGYYDIVNPTVPIEMYKHIALLSIVNPDLSQTVSNFTNLANNGHNLIATGREQQITQAVDELNQQAYNWYKISAGTDGLISHYMNQLIVSGAISSEDILDETLSGIRKITIVPTYSIRFRYIDGDYRPFQQPDHMGLAGNRDPLSLIELNQETYSYYALQTHNNSPYAIPPFISALDPIMMQKEAMDNLRFALKKLGLLGLNVVKVKPLKREPGEDEDLYLKRNQDHLKRVADSVSSNFSKGLLVVTDGWEIDNHALGSNLAGVKDILQIKEEQVFSGAKTQSSLHGRAYSSTETYSTVVYNMLIAMASNIRRLVKRRHEKSMRLHLQLCGIDVDSVVMTFNKDKRLDPNTEALANRYDLKSILDKAQAGVISLQEAAQELGYEDWYDDALFKLMVERQQTVRQFRWNPDTQRYQLQRNRYDLDRYRISQKDEAQETNIAKDAELKIREHIDNYLKETIAYYDDLKSDVKEYAYKYLLDNLSEIEKNHSLLYDAVHNYIKNHPDYQEVRKKDSFFRSETKKITKELGEYYKEKDKTAFFGDDPGVTFVFGEGDLAASEFFANVDTFYFSKFVDNENFGTQINQFITSFLEAGESEYFPTDDAKREFYRLFNKAFQKDFDVHMKRIIRASISRIRSYSYLSQMNDAEFDYAIVAVLDSACDICRPLHGKRIPVKKAYSKIQDFVNSIDLNDTIEDESMQRVIDFIEGSNVTLDDLDDIDSRIDKGDVIPPFHILCKCILRALFD